MCLPLAPPLSSPPHQQLIDDRGRLIATGLSPPCRTEGIKLVNEEDGWCICSKLLKRLTDAACTNARIDLEQRRRGGGGGRA